ncbi:hypothetical protein [Flavobacterium sp. TBRC 19031]|uniref:hypothetical protein n=1 Tax=Flavobacterium mekongense TaxID=3379707 RepID=UPI00399AC5D8
MNDKEIKEKIKELDLTYEAENPLYEVIQTDKMIFQFQVFPKSSKKKISAKILDKMIDDPIFSQELWMQEQYDENLQKEIIGYINVFRKKIAEFLVDDMGQEIKIVGFPDGVLLDVKYEENILNRDFFAPKAKNLKEAFNQTGRKGVEFFDGEELSEFENKINNNQMTSEGTQILIAESIVIFKGEDKDFWSAKAAQDDVDLIIQTVKGERGNANKLG